MKGRGDPRSADYVDPLEHMLVAVDGKPFENLSWRLIHLLVHGVKVERHELSEGASLKISNEVDVIYVERGALRPPDDKKTRSWDALGSTHFGVPVQPDKLVPASPYRHTTPVLLNGTYTAHQDTVVHIFCKV